MILENRNQQQRHMNNIHGCCLCVFIRDFKHLFAIGRNDCFFKKLQTKNSRKPWAWIKNENLQILTHCGTRFPIYNP